MNRAPLVSVIIPAYNGGDLLGEAIRSVLGQTYAGLELIVVDDASTDDTPDVLAGFDDPRLTYLRHGRNQGPDAARRTALDVARGEIIAFLDQDDLFHPRKLETHVAFLQEHPLTGLTYNPHYALLHPSRSIAGIWRPPDSVTLFDLVAGFPIPPSSGVLRREWALRTDLWEERTFFRGREIVILGRLFLAGCRFSLIDRALNYRRIHVGRQFGNPVSKCEEERRCQEIMLGDPRVPLETTARAALAFASSYLIWAYVALAQDETADGQALLRQAVRLDPALLEGAPNRLVDLLLSHAVVDAEDAEAHLRRIFRQLPPEVPDQPAYLAWAVRQAHLMKAMQHILWGEPADADPHLARFSALGGGLDEVFLARACHELMSYEAEAGPEATRPAIRRFAAALSRIERGGGRRLSAAYDLARAFRRYARGQRRGVPIGVARAFAANPRCLSNRGAWLILLRTMALRGSPS